MKGHHFQAEPLSHKSSQSYCWWLKGLGKRIFALCLGAKLFKLVQVSSKYTLRLELFCAHVWAHTQTRSDTYTHIQRESFNPWISKRVDYKIPEFAIAFYKGNTVPYLRTLQTFQSKSMEMVTGCTGGICVHVKERISLSFWRWEYIALQLYSCIYTHIGCNSGRNSGIIFLIHLKNGKN